MRPQEGPFSSEPEAGQREWREAGFDVHQKLKEVRGPLIEVGGPSVQGFEMINQDQLGKKLHITNITPGVARFDAKTGALAGYEGRVDFRADAAQLPFPDESVGALFFSSLSLTGSNYKTAAEFDAARERLCETALQEAARVLEIGGMLIWSRGFPADINLATRLNFKSKQYIIRQDSKGAQFLSAIFEKTEQVRRQQKARQRLQQRQEEAEERFQARQKKAQEARERRMADTGEAQEQRLGLKDSKDTDTGNRLDPEFEKIKEEAARRAGGRDSSRYAEELRRLFDEWQQRENAEHEQKLKDLLREFEEKMRIVREAATLPDNRRNEGGGLEQPPRSEARPETPLKPEHVPPKQLDSPLERTAAQELGLHSGEYDMIMGGGIQNLSDDAFMEIMNRVSEAKKLYPDAAGIKNEFKDKIINNLLDEYNRRKRYEG